MGIYTRAGDGGDSLTLKGERLRKDHPVFHVEGMFDALVVALGAARFECQESSDPVRRDVALAVQRDLMLLAACVSREDDRYLAGLKLSPSDMETLVDSAIPVALTGFVVPGSSRRELAFHHARVTCRELERWLVSYPPAASRPEVMGYVNRLSDLLFALAVGEPLSGIPVTRPGL